MTEHRNVRTKGMCGAGLWRVTRGDCPICGATERDECRRKHAVEAKIIDEMMKGLRCAKALLDNINEFGVCTSPEIYDAADTAVRAALDKVLGNE